LGQPSLHQLLNAFEKNSTEESGTLAFGSVQFDLAVLFV